MPRLSFVRLGRLCRGSRADAGRLGACAAEGTESTGRAGSAARAAGAVFGSSRPGRVRLPATRARFTSARRGVTSRERAEETPEARFWGRALVLEARPRRLMLRLNEPAARPRANRTIGRRDRRPALTNGDRLARPGRSSELRGTRTSRSTRLPPARRPNRLSSAAVPDVPLTSLLRTRRPIERTRRVHPRAPPGAASAFDVGERGVQARNHAEETPEARSRGSGLVGEARPRRPMMRLTSLRRARGPIARARRKGWSRPPRRTERREPGRR